MLIEYNPTITGGFVYKVMARPEVAALLQELDISEREKHDLVKSVLIVGTRDLECNINEKIVRAKRG